MPKGYCGRILHVDLTAGRLEVEEPDDAFYRKYLGGSAMGTYYILKRMPAGADPLGPDNVLTVFAGPVTGTPISGQSRASANARSPLSGAIGDSQAGGFWPAELKFAGFDGVVVVGRSSQPQYLWLHDGQAELRPADPLWGQQTGPAEAAIRRELDDERVQVLQCGPAGERGVRFANLINMSNRAHGRTGMGAVMASKGLKAIAVRGRERPQLHDAEAVRALARWGRDHFSDSDIAGMGQYGTAEVLAYQHAAGGLPTHNWRSGSFEGFERISGETMHDTILQKRDTCYACVVRCKRVVAVEEGPFQVDPHYGGPEYETLATFGSYCAVDDLAAIAKANELCNRYGMDTIACGATIALAMECFERGLLTLEDTGGLELRFGQAGAMVAMVERIARREGLGDLLAEGSARLARKLGPEAEALAMTVKDHELPAHMPQVKRSLGLIYAVNPFGADHQSSEHDSAYEGDYAGYAERMAALDLLDPQPERSLGAEKVRFALYTQYLYSLLDSVSVCQFVWGPSWHLYGPMQLVELVRAVTGWNASLWELMQVGRRRLNMQRLFNSREGLGRAEDRLPARLFEPLQGGASDGLALDRQELERARSLYYAMAGWDEDGRPTPATLQELGLGWAVDVVP
ncbi:MAG: aldehyde ferredoxin oxidoreductase family protein [Chloroflexia bacterium]|nr:aldehyde ferredoxin oxidoreductase family protein [Chloroflexia bacterium]